MLFRKAGVTRALQNLGGIGNVSVVGERLEDTLAFDTGPGNMVLDGLARRATGGRLQCDLDGTLSRQGRVLPALLAELLAHPFLARPPPRSAGREGFGEALVERLWARHAGQPLDLMATALEFTVEATARAYEAHVLPRFALEGVWVSGGCEADFEVRTSYRPSPAPSGGAGHLVCESREYQYNLCQTGRLRGAQLVRQLSEAPCIEGQTWGVSRDGIWVDRGCRADFEVRR